MKRQNPSMNPQQVLILQGWHGSGPLHWQMRWVEKYGYQVLTQSDWIRPLRGDWLARLDDVVSDLKAPVYLVAHSLGCLQVASWAAISKQTHKVKAALLVAPSDVEARNFEDVLSSWRPLSLEKLPFINRVSFIKWFHRKIYLHRLTLYQHHRFSFYTSE